MSKTKTMRLFHRHILLVLVVFVACKQDNRTQIEVNIRNSKTPLEIILLQQDFDKTTLKKSLTLKGNKQNCVFKLKDIQEPSFYQLQLKGEQTRTIILLIEPGEQASLDINMEDFRHYAVTGSEGSVKTQLLNNKILKTKKTLDSLNNLFINTKNQHEKEILQQQYYQIIDEQRAFSEQFIWENPRSRASVMALYQQYGDNLFVFDRAEDLRLFKVVGSSLQAMFPESEYTKGLLRDIANQEKIVANYRLTQLIKESESTLPEIALPNHRGDTILLSSLSGKVILLSFWASVDSECLMENRELLDIYETYKGKGFEIYQISLDTNKEVWLEAIKRNALPWINVRADAHDAQLILGQYNVAGIPSNYLISWKFDIVGKNLFGKELVTKLKEIL
ncbi:MAG TPA: TlpA disulfide reductase family protein [Tenuifilaceae bacterium]|nr:TlpA disulfide reductase family protein [Tenuifilaceae bacterium]